MGCPIHVQHPLLEHASQDSIPPPCKMNRQLAVLYNLLTNSDPSYH